MAGSDQERGTRFGLEGRLTEEEQDRMAENLSHWEERADEHGACHDASWADAFAWTSRRTRVE